VEVRAPARPVPYVVTVAPEPTGDGWLVADPSEAEPTWRATFEAAIGLTLELACAVLAERIGRQLVGSGQAVAGRAGREPADIC
jgi:hypothetical protein